MSTATVFRYIKPDVSPREDLEGFVDGASRFIKQHVKPDDKVKIMVSGGVDSAVTATLFHLEVGDRLYVTHVDTGFMRLIRGREESEIIAERFSEFKNFKLVNARTLFFLKLVGIPDAEQKRLGFRKAYETVTDQQMAEYGCNVMTQGTILPDIIETDGGVKSQHNVHLKFRRVGKVVEPLAGLYKDEVRKVAEYLYSKYGMKSVENVSRRQPFPGPGLSVRTVGIISSEKLGVEKKANDIVEQMVDEYTQELYGVNLYIDPKRGMQIPFQSFAATFDGRLMGAPAEAKDLLKEKLGKDVSCNVLDVDVTGVKDGGRVYARPLCIESDVDLDYDILRAVGSEVPVKTGLSRVLYNLSSGVASSKYLVAVRSVNSVDAMTARVNEIPLKTLRRIADEVVKRCDVGGVYWDISPKPPATIEYE